MLMFLAVILGLVQGFTEFLPVSSSGHLVLFQTFLAPYFGSFSNPLAFDIAVHVATGLVVAFVMRQEIFQVLRKGVEQTPDGCWVRQMVGTVLLATIPAALIGILWKEQIEQAFSSLGVALNGFLLTALFLELAHRRQITQSDTGKSAALEPLSWKLPSYFQALVIGLFQAIAITPGVSRSGSTIAAALVLGLGADSAVRFSFLLLLPVVLGSIVFAVEDLQKMNSEELQAVVVGSLVTIVAAAFAVKILFYVVRGARLRYFAIYTALLGTVVRFL